MLLVVVVGLRLLFASDGALGVQALLAEARFQDAANLSLQLLRAAPNDPSLLDLAGRAFLSLDRPADAIPLFQRELGLAPMSLRAAHFLATAYLALNDFPNAHLLLTRLTVSDPADSSNWYRLGILLYRNGYYPGAIGALDHALLGNQLPAAERNRARITKAISLVETGRYAKAEPALRDCLGVLQNEADLDLLLSYARVLYETDRLPAALIQAERALAAAPGNAAAHLWRGRVLQRLGHLPQALTEAESARDLALDSPAPRNMLVRLYQTLDRPADAAREAEWLRVHEAQ